MFGYQNDYLIGVMDPYEASAKDENPYAAWTVTLTPSQLGSRLGIGPVKSVVVTTSRLGNVTKLEFISASGEERVTRDDDGNYVFKGSGFGHNVGMSQWGAYAMAKYYDKDYRFILGFYYTKVGLSSGELPPKPERPPEEEAAVEPSDPLPEGLPNGVD